MAATIIICLIIAALMAAGVSGMHKRIASGCCGSSSASERRIRVKDRDLRHYPYCTTLAIRGMHCRSCAVRVENSLNAIDGVFADVSLRAGTAAVHMKRKIPEARLRQAVMGAGYTAAANVPHPAPP